MAKDKERDKEKRMFVGYVWNCAAELKLLLAALLIVCSVATLFQFLPFRFSLSASDLGHCLSHPDVLSGSKLAVGASPTTSPPAAAPLPLPQLPSPPPPSPPLSPPQFPPPPPSLGRDRTLPNTAIKRAFNPFGAAAYNFILMSAYRGGPNTFAVVGLASKPLHVFGDPAYQCEWIPLPSARNRALPEPLSAAAYKILPDWGYGRVYTAVVVNCTFPRSVGSDGAGGKLVFYASTGGGGDRNFNLTDRIEALEEAPGALDPSLFGSPPRYEYLYCGSPLYGDLSPQRVREWMAYHVRLFGGRSHFAIYDAGGVHDGVRDVLKPWMELGYVTVHDIRDQERFDGYYHNQFVVVNDCLHRYKFHAKWMFFFDADEFIYVPPRKSLRSVVDSLSGYTQFTIEQMPMSSELCFSADSGKTSKRWGFEKLVYRDVKRGIRRDRKYAVQPRNVLATGVHMSQNLAPSSRTTHHTEHHLKYFHYHGTIAQRRDPCRKFLNDTSLTLTGVPYVLDTTMRSLAGPVRAFELRTIGRRLWRTPQ